MNQLVAGPETLPEIPSKIAARVTLTHVNVAMFEPWATVVLDGASRRLLVRIRYDKSGEESSREIEPYAVRITAAGAHLLLAFDHKSSEVRSFRFDRIRDAMITDRSYVPRYKMEIGDVTGISLDPPVVKAASSAWSGPLSPAICSIRGENAFGSYTVVCPFCLRRFIDNAYRTYLDPHSDSSGAACPGFHGFPV